ncbi:NADPH-dependent 7-cyano-7-deazaguanine reductase QueF [Marinilabilia rubra]|uniref:NADPH-dependent 7-cyano-7-deazaguanine reductase QueF n=1 Tax=Marinilabilia rubra TaxID=2162893 RepID=A0A2U2BCN9_9BACT|nr:NADPH-dependent 7-cyano-7-deazaguanine reductase QueF [Marinilabilia rubra]PWE00793.1 NADPH-dependent 7-cyano-7-deazaguanine reductase QueF [Marinilabilia rubra]
MNEDKYLGKVTSYPQKYSPEILIPVPRHLNRKDYNIKENNLPFTGYDTWHAYELSFLTEKGLPVVGLLKLVYPSDSTFLVESKSFKLYLNSFNMERYGKTPAEGLEIVLSTIRYDLNQTLKTNVTTHFFQGDESQSHFDFDDFEILENSEVAVSSDFKNYTETPELLAQSEDLKKTIKVATHLLRSNCKVTHQPDWGSAYIHLKGNQIPDKISLLKYIVSVRNENHFHEEICEMIYKRLMDIFSPQELMVTCIYTRRGGIDICPARASRTDLLPKFLISPGVLTKKLLRQ